MNEFPIKPDGKNSSKILFHSKNVDLDAFFLDLENKNEAAERKKTKTQNQNSPEYSPIAIQNLKNAIQKHREPQILDDLVITKLKSEKIESFLTSYNIKASKLGSLSLLIGKVVYTFKIHNIKTSFSWSIRKTITEFAQLFKKLKTYMKNEKQLNIGKDKFIDFPCADSNKKLNFDYVFCKKTEETNPDEILSYLDEFLNTMLEIPQIRNFITFFDFIELSCIFHPITSKKFKECYLKKKPGGRFRQGCFRKVYNSVWSLWITRWFLISEDGIKYFSGPSKDKCIVREMLLFDNSLKIEYGFKQTGSIYGINLNTTSRKLILKTSSLWELYDVIGSIEEAIKNCAYIQENRFSSFAPQRDSLAYCKAYVDGEEYFSDVYKALNTAQNEIFITDWWLSPELHLKRPINEEGLNEDSRLDRVLAKIAHKGVKIYIIIYCEVSFVLPLDSNHTKSHLEKLSSNIKVLQHPSDLICWWSHHEKLVIIDQEIAFLGGLDLCFGRMDTKEHKLLDSEKENGEVYWPGIDYSNCRIADFRNVKNYEKPLISRETPRMPWHDIAIQVSGVPVKDLARHFIQYWNYAKIDLAERSGKYLDTKTSHSKKSSMSKSYKKFKMNKNKTKKVIEVSKLIESQEGKKRERALQNLNISVSKFVKQNEIDADWNLDYDEFKLPLDIHIKNYAHYNMMSAPLHKSHSDNLFLHKLNSTEAKKSFKKSFTSKKNPMEEFKFNSIKIQKTQTLKEMPKKDLQAQILIKKDFLQLYESMDRTKENFVDYEHEIQGYKEAYTQFMRKKTKEPIQKHAKTIKINENFYEDNMLQLNSESIRKKNPVDQIRSCRCQIVRSASNWSCGLAPNRYENSIQFAYLQLIEDSQYYIYIENQFFISSLAGPSVENNIAKALLYRIKKAHIYQETFKIYVVMPLLPGFEGDVADKGTSVMRIQLHWEYATISRSETSLITSLIKEGIDPEKYLVFLGLRNHAKLKKPLTEIVYVHSKLMIVDDRFVILGSANINDRSMNGNRDSEIGVVYFIKHFFLRKKKSHFFSFIFVNFNFSFFFHFLLIILLFNKFFLFI